jgi:hypothetical protein
MLIRKRFRLPRDVNKLRMQVTGKNESNIM